MNLHKFVTHIKISLYGNYAYSIYSRKFSRMVDINLQFRRFNFCRYAHSCPLCTVQSSLFRGFKFRGQAIIYKNRENLTPQKFPTIIWYIL